MGTLASYLEPALTVGSGAVAQPLSGLWGLLNVFDADAVKRAQDALTYQPYTEGGKKNIQRLGGLLADAKDVMVDRNPPVKAVVDAYNGATDYVGERSPALGALMAAAPTAAGALIGPGGVAAKNVVRGMAENAMAPTTLSKQAGAIRISKMGDLGFDPRYDKRVLERQKMNNLTTVVDTPDRPALSSVNLADYRGHPFITSMADRTGDGILYAVNNTEFKNPVTLQAGKRYMFGNDGLWASADKPVNDLMEQAHYAKMYTGKDPLFIPWTMAPSGSDFSSMTGNTMMQYANSNMGRGGRKAVNNFVKKFIPDFVGIENPASMEQFASQRASVRKKIQAGLDKNFRNDGGLGIGEARLAISDPTLLNARDGSVTHAGLLDSSGQVIDSVHLDYPRQVPGHGLGLLNGNHNIFEYLQGQGHGRNVIDPAAPKQTDIRALQMKPYSGIIDDELLNYLGLK